MATVRVIYISHRDDKDLTLCFSCAVKEALIGRMISMETTDYESTQCDICESFLKDTITI
jgi:hypothetical protein